MLHPDRFREQPDLDLHDAIESGKVLADVAISALKDSIESRRELANTNRELEIYKRDELTDLRVRRAYVRDSDVLRRSVYEGTEPHGYNSVIVVMTDLHGLRDINKKGGHPAGDKILSDLGHFLPDIFSPEENILVIPGRLGGDEFAVTLAFDDTETPPEWVGTTTLSRINTWAIHNTPHGVWLGNPAISSPDKDMKQAFKEADPKAPTSRIQKLGKKIVNLKYAIGRKALD